jgi:hypothetical protein
MATRAPLPEADWKAFRKLREIALDRFCRRILDELDTLRRDDSKSAHERYLAVYRHLRDRDDHLGRAFDDPRRSRMLPQLAVILALDLLEPAELSRLSEPTRTDAQALARHNIL